MNIHLQSKPEWYLQINPAGQVPCLQFDGTKTVPESLISSEYLDQVYPGRKLISSDPYKNAQDRLFIERFSKFTTTFQKAVRGTDEESINEVKAAATTTVGKTKGSVANERNSDLPWKV